MISQVSELHETAGLPESVETLGVAVVQTVNAFREALKPEQREVVDTYYGNHLVSIGTHSAEVEASVVGARTLRAIGTYYKKHPDEDPNWVVQIPDDPRLVASVAAITRRQEVDVSGAACDELFHERASTDHSSESGIVTVGLTRPVYIMQHAPKDENPLGYVGLSVSSPIFSSGGLPDRRLVGNLADPEFRKFLNGRSVREPNPSTKGLPN